MTLTKALVDKQHSVLVNNNFPQIKTKITDGGNILHRAILNHRKSTYATIDRDLLVKIDPAMEKRSLWYLRSTSLHLLKTESELYMVLVFNRHSPLLAMTRFRDKVEQNS